MAFPRWQRGVVTTMKPMPSSGPRSHCFAAEAIDRRSFLALGAVAAGSVLSRAANGQEGDWSPEHPVHYPDSRIVVLDRRFNKYKIGNTAVQRLWTGALWAEGCAWHAGGRYLIWSDIPNNRQMRWLDEDAH